MDDIAEAMLAVGRSGGVVTVKHKVTGREESLPVQPPPIIGATQVSADKPTGVGAEIEFARNHAYSKISVKLWATVPCLPGLEAATLANLVTMLDAQAGIYVERASERLISWSEG